MSTQQLPFARMLSFSISRVASFGIGISLIAASLLKTRQWIIDPSAASDIPPQPILRVAVIDFELAVGFWLISGLLPRIAWSIAIVTFSVFLSITIRDVFVGKASCSCFGSIVTPPFLVAIFDLVVIVCLVRLFPKVLSRSRIVTFLSFFLLFFTSAAATIALLHTDTHPQVHVTPETFDLGRTQPGITYRGVFSISNDGFEEIGIASIETSCHCLTVYIPTRNVPPGKQIGGEIVFTPEIGAASQNLSMTIRFYDSKRKILALMTVNASN